MKIINENLEMVDYEEKEEAKTSTMLGYKLMAKIALVDLIYNMNKNTCHKINFVIIMAQLITFVISIICQFIFNEFRAIISIAGASCSTILLFIVMINTKISDKAIKNANKQKNIIEECIDKLEKEK